MRRSDRRKFRPGKGGARTSADEWRWYHWLRLNGTAAEVAAIEGRIVEQNMGLFKSAKFGGEMDGEVALRVVRGFDPRRGFYFSTYAWRSLIRQSKRDYGERFRGGALVEPDKIVRTCEAAQVEAKRADGVDVGELRALVQTLPWRSMVVCLLRWPAEPDVKMGLAEVGAVLGVSKERIRQIEVETVRRLRKVAEIAERLRSTPRVADFCLRVQRYVGPAAAAVRTARPDELWTAAAACVAAQDEEGLSIVAELLAMPAEVRAVIREAIG